MNTTDRFEINEVIIAAQSNKVSTVKRNSARSNHILRAITRAVMGLVVCGYVGCGRGKEVPPAPPEPSVEVPSKQQASAKREEDAAAVEPAVEYTYRAGERRDPFASLIRGVEVETVSVQQEEAGPFVAVVEGGQYSPLQRFDLEELRLVGIIDTGDLYTGLVEVADGKSYFLRNGTLVGRNGGVVSRVIKDRVVITETYRNPLGETRTKDVYLTFSKTGGD